MMMMILRLPKIFQIKKTKRQDKTQVIATKNILALITLTMTSSAVRLVSLQGLTSRRSMTIDRSKMLFPIVLFWCLLFSGCSSEITTDNLIMTRCTYL